MLTPMAVYRSHTMNSAASKKRKRAEDDTGNNKKASSKKQSRPNGEEEAAAEAGGASGKDLQRIYGGRASAVADDKSGHVAAELGMSRQKVSGAVRLFEEGNTLPFIARYRKEQTGSMDEEELRQVERCLAKVTALEARRGVIAGHLERQNLLHQGTKASERLLARLLGAGTMEELEDFWEPFKAIFH